MELHLEQSGNRVCADCGSPDPKWASLNFGVLICIKCSGIHRSLGVHTTKVMSIKLDEWTDEQVCNFISFGGNSVVNVKYEASLPDDYRKPKSDASFEERSDFIRKKYEGLEFSSSDELFCPCLPHRSSASSQSSFSHCSSKNKRIFDKQATKHRIRHAFRNSWRRRDSEIKHPKTSSSLAGMVEFVGLIKVNVVKGTNLAIRDVVTSDPYVILTLGTQSVKTSVIKNNLNPVWNENLMLSIPEDIPPLRVLVYDKDTFSSDDFMGLAEINIKPLVDAAQSYERWTRDHGESTQLGLDGNSMSTPHPHPIQNGFVSVVDGTVTQEVTVSLNNVERGLLQINLHCLPLTQ